VEHTLMTSSTTPTRTPTALFWQLLPRYTAIAIIITMGQLHPGQWATNVASGAYFGVGMIVVQLGAGILTLLLHAMALTLSITTDQNLAQLSRTYFTQPVSRILWLGSELALIASDMTAILGMALAARLLFGWALTTGVYVAAGVVVVTWGVQQRQLFLRASSGALLIAGIGVGVGYLLTMTAPTARAFSTGIHHVTSIVNDPHARTLAFAIIGATTLPHTHYFVTQLHKSMPATSDLGTLRWGIGTLIIAMGSASIINVVSMIIPAAAFHDTAYQHVARIADAYALLLPVTGTIAAGFVLGFVVLATGLAAIVTSTYTRQVVWVSFWDVCISNWLMRLGSMATTIVPALLVAHWYADTDPSSIIIQSQIFLLIPLLISIIFLFVLTGNPHIMHLATTTPWIHRGRWGMVALSMMLGGCMLWGYW